MSPCDHPGCHLLAGHGNDHQTEIAPPLTAAERDIIARRQSGELLGHTTTARLDEDDLGAFNDNEQEDYRDE